MILKNSKDSILSTQGPYILYLSDEDVVGLTLLLVLFRRLIEGSEKKN